MLDPASENYDLFPNCTIIKYLSDITTWYFVDAAWIKHRVQNLWIWVQMRNLMQNYDEAQTIKIT